MKDLENTFARIRGGNVKLRLDKCHFGYSGGEFLGHYVSSEGRRPTHGAAEKLLQFPVPCSVRELQRFIGSLNYYRDYIPNIARIALPLYAITKRGARWTGEKEHQKLLTRSAEVVEEPTCLAFPAWDKAVYVEADASLGGVAAVLSQKRRRIWYLEAH